MIKRLCRLSSLKMGQPLPPPPEDPPEFYMGQQMRMHAAAIAASQQHQQQQGPDSVQFIFHKSCTVHPIYLVHIGLCYRQDNPYCVIWYLLHSVSTVISKKKIYKVSVSPIQIFNQPAKMGGKRNMQKLWIETL